MQILSFILTIIGQSNCRPYDVAIVRVTDILHDNSTIYGLDEDESTYYESDIIIQLATSPLKDIFQKEILNFSTRS
jgi:hypothetical protein